MKNIRFRLFTWALLAAGLALTSFGHAAPPSGDAAKQIPDPLKAWEAWATWDDIHRFCPTPFSDANKHLCFWPSRMGLQVNQAGAQFDMIVTVFSETWIPLPGGQGVWPTVKSNGAPLVVIARESSPSVHLSAGTFYLEGAYHWTAVPPRISIPHEIGILALVIDGQPVEVPSWDADGYLWLKRSASIEEVDKNSLSMKLYAVLEDGIPQWLHTEVELVVSGKSREEVMGVILPAGWKLASVEGPIPVAVDDAGRMKAQVRAGRWTLHADAFRLDNTKDFHYAKGTKPAVADELIGFRAKSDFRTVEVSGMPSVDVSQTTFPEQWRGLPVYRWDTSTPFQIEERMRGMGEQKLEGLHITRELWLDEGGREFTFRDEISGRMQQIWRLDAAEGQDLGSVRSGGQGQLITRNPQNGASGVEVRTRNLDLEATGRMPRADALSATGWRADADAVRLTLNLPPGWRLFALFGADWVRGDWLTAWSLLDLFLLLVFTLAVFRMWGFGAALLAFVAFGLSYHEPDAPRYLWLILLVPLALQRVVPEGWGHRVVSVGKWLILAAFVFVFVPFIAGQIVSALYPQLESVAQYQGVGFRRVATPSDYTESRNAGATPEAAPPGAVVEPAPAAATDTLRRKLERIIIPKLEFREATLSEAVEFLKKKSGELDEDSPAGEKGVNIIVKPGAPPTEGPNPLDARITVSLSNIPLIEAIKYVSGLANMKYKVEPYAVSIVPVTENTDVFITKEWKISPGLIPAGGPEVAKNWLIGNGVAFNGVAIVSYFPKTARLIVRNTQDQLDLIDTMIQSGAAVEAPVAPAAAPAGMLSDASMGRRYVSDNMNFDAKARIQTGPGVPEWKWREVSFGWNGPVSATQQVRPVLISLTLERALTVLRVVLLLLLAAVLLGVRKIGRAVFRTSGKAVALLLFALLVSHASAQTIPSADTLEKLRKRLLEVSDAYPHAADIPSVTLALHERKVVLDAEIHAAIRTAVPLPGRLPAWSPVTVLVDDKPDVSLRRDDGYLWVLVEAGVHHVHVEGSLSNVSEWEWTYVLKPRQVKIDAPEWNVTGVKPDGVVEAQVILSRKQKAVAEQSSYEQQPVTAIAVVDRQIELGLVWLVHTTVSRLSPLGKAAALRIPLVPGENVLTAGATVKDGFIEVRLGAQEQSFNWESELAVVKQLQLSTHAEDTWVERWHLVASPVWDVNLSGLAPIFEPANASLVPVWQPWPGESIELAMSRPEAIAGATMTVNRATYELALGNRQRTSKLGLSLRCSVGEDFQIELPADAEVTSLFQDGNAIPVRKETGKLIIPVHPGEQKMAIGWKRNEALESRAAMDEVRLPVESANIQTTITVPEDRWVLWASGPQRGPAVRFWGILICSLLAALALGRMVRSPLKSVEWMLLVIGLTQVPLAAGLAVVGWLFFVAWRGSDSFQRQRNFSYNTRQIVLVALTVAALGILISAVGEGLLGRPEMFITGNDSTQTALRWFKDRSDHLLPSCACVSISIWWYRFFMLVWALWLAMALIGWLQQGWRNFGVGGYFRRKPKAQPTPPAPPPIPNNA